MDIVRDKPRSRRKYILAGLGAIAVIGVSVALARLEPAAPSVDGGTIYFDSVVRKEFVREVRGSGNLVPENIRWITAVTAGRVERLYHLPGDSVDVSTVLLELANPDVQIEGLNADQELTDAEARLVELTTTLESNRLNQASAVAQLRQEAADAARRAIAGAELLKKNLIVPLDQKQAEERAAALKERLGIEENRLKILTEGIPNQLSVQKQQVERLRKITAFQHGQQASMTVRAGATGVLTELPLQIGQYANAGATLAKVVPTPMRLKAVLRIPETQARDLAIGQRAVIDTRAGLAPGRVVRMDPAPVNGTVAVDVAIDGALPSGSRPDLSVDGTVELDRLDDVLHVQRPPFAQQNSPGTVFKVVEGGKYAVRVQVKYGQTSVSRVQILEGLNVGDLIVMSDMSRHDNVDRVRIK